MAVEGFDVFFLHAEAHVVVVVVGAEDEFGGVGAEEEEVRVER